MPFKLSVAAGLFAALACAQSTPVVRLQNLAHSTESLDKTVAFYRDVLGLPVNGDPLSQKPQKLDADMSKFTGTQGMSFRAATFRIPNAGFGFELTEFTGAPRTTLRPNVQDIGTATLSLQVRDMKSVLAKVKASGAVIVTTGGELVNPRGPTSTLREIMVRDPDGFFIELLQPDPMPNVTGDIVGGSIQLSVADAEKTAAFLHEAVGFEAGAVSALGTLPVVAQLLGLTGAQWRLAHGKIPGTTGDFGLIAYSSVPREKVMSSARDPGSPAFTMVVRDIESATSQWTKAGGTVATTGGKPIVRANGAGNVFVRDINGLLWELIQAANQATKQ
ncbi:MAG: VOC family protein [Acidobacteriota bacterium]